MSLSLDQINLALGGFCNSLYPGQQPELKGYPSMPSQPPPPPPEEKEYLEQGGELGGEEEEEGEEEEVSSPEQQYGQYSQMPQFQQQSQGSMPQSYIGSRIPSITQLRVPEIELQGESSSRDGRGYRYPQSSSIYQSAYGGRDGRWVSQQNASRNALQRAYRDGRGMSRSAFVQDYLQSQQEMARRQQQAYRDGRSGSYRSQQLGGYGYGRSGSYRPQQQVGGYGYGGRDGRSSYGSYRSSSYNRNGSAGSYNRDGRSSYFSVNRGPYERALNRGPYERNSYRGSYASSQTDRLRQALAESNLRNQGYRY